MMVEASAQTVRSGQTIAGAKSSKSRETIAYLNTVAGPELQWSLPHVCLSGSLFRDKTKRGNKQPVRLDQGIVSRKSAHDFAERAQIFEL